MDLSNLIGTLAEATNAQEKAAETSQEAMQSLEEVTTQLNLYRDLLRSTANPGSHLIERMADAYLNAEDQHTTYTKSGRQINKGQIIAMLDQLTRFYRERAGMTKELTT